TELLFLASGHASTGVARAVTSLMAAPYTPSSWSTVTDQPNPDACCRAPRASLASLPLSVTRGQIASAYLAGSCPATSTPEKPSRTAVRRPPAAAATTGVPQACASTATSPNDSEYDGTTTIVAARYQSARSACGHGGSSLTFRDTPSSAASSVRLSGSFLPVPLGPPTNATTSRSASQPWSCTSFAAARSSTSGALSGWTRPANINTIAFCGRRRRLLAWDCDPGLNTDRSTPGLTVATRRGSASYSLISSRASALVLATMRSAVAMTSASPLILMPGSAASPAASEAFFTLPRVCMDWTSGTPQRSLATA